jgi:replicative DNA helicase
MYVEKILPSDDSTLAAVAAIVRPEDFMREKNGLIFKACLSLYQRHEAVDQVTLARELSVAGQLADMGDMAYLSHLVAITPAAAHAEHYAQVGVPHRHHAAAH